MDAIGVPRRRGDSLLLPLPGKAPSWSSKEGKGLFMDHFMFPEPLQRKPGSETPTSCASRERTTASSCNLSLEELHDAR